MDTQRWRRQDGLIREALYIFLVVALVMAILLDGVALMKVQQSARDLASDAGREAQTTYVNTADAKQAQQAANDHIINGDGEMLHFKVAANTTTTPTFTVTVQTHTETYLYKYLGYVPGLKDWVEEVQNPVITESTT